MKKAISFISALTLTFTSMGGIQGFTATDTEKGTVTITVIDSETNKLFRKDTSFSVIGSSGTATEGMGGAIHLGGWNTYEANPYTFTDVNTDFSYAIQHVGKSCNGYSYTKDVEKAEWTFDFAESTNQNVIIYMKKHWFGEPVEYSFEDVLAMDEKAYKDFCRTNDAEYRTAEEIQADFQINADKNIMLTPDKYLKEGMEDVTSSPNLSDINSTNLNDYDFSGVMTDLGLPVEYYDFEVNPNSFMVTNRADTLSAAGALVPTFYKLAEVSVKVKDEYKNSDEYIRLNQMKYSMPMLCDSFDSLRFVAPNGPVTAPPETVLKGDINCDGEFTVADAVTLQRWLLGASDAELKSRKAADLFEDDRVDVFDLIEMKRNLIEQGGIEDVLSEAYLY